MKMQGHTSRTAASQRQLHTNSGHSLRHSWSRPPQYTHAACHPVLCAAAVDAAAVSPAPSAQHAAKQRTHRRYQGRRHRPADPPDTGSGSRDPQGALTIRLTEVIKGSHGETPPTEDAWRMSLAQQMLEAFRDEQPTPGTRHVAPAPVTGSQPASAAHRSTQASAQSTAVADMDDAAAGRSGENARRLVVGHTPGSKAQQATASTQNSTARRNRSHQSSPTRSTSPNGERSSPSTLQPFHHSRLAHRSALDTPQTALDTQPVKSLRLQLLTQGPSQLVTAVSAMASQQALHRQMYPDTALVFQVQPRATNPPRTLHTVQTAGNTSAGSLGQPEDGGSRQQALPGKGKGKKQGGDRKAAQAHHTLGQSGIAGAPQTQAAGHQGSSGQAVTAQRLPQTQQPEQTQQAPTHTQQALQQPQQGGGAPADGGKDDDTGVFGPVWDQQLNLSWVLASVPQSVVAVRGRPRSFRVDARDTVASLKPWLQAGLEREGHMRLAVLGKRGVTAAVKAILVVAEYFERFLGLGVAVLACRTPNNSLDRWRNQPSTEIQLDCFFCLTSPHQQQAGRLLVVPPGGPKHRAHHVQQLMRGLVAGTEELQQRQSARQQRVAPGALQGEQPAQQEPHHLQQQGGLDTLPGQRAAAQLEQHEQQPLAQDGKQQGVGSSAEGQDRAQHQQQPGPRSGRQGEVLSQTQNAAGEQQQAADKKAPATDAAQAAAPAVAPDSATAQVPPASAMSLQQQPRLAPRQEPLPAQQQQLQQASEQQEPSPQLQPPQQRQPLATTRLVLSEHQLSTDTFARKVLKLTRTGDEVILLGRGARETVRLHSVLAQGTLILAHYQAALRESVLEAYRSQLEELTAEAEEQAKREERRVTDPAAAEGPGGDLNTEAMWADVEGASTQGADTAPGTGQEFAVPQQTLQAGQAAVQQLGAGEQQPQHPSQQQQLSEPRSSYLLQVPAAAATAAAPALQRPARPTPPSRPAAAPATPTNATILPAATQSLAAASTAPGHQTLSATPAAPSAPLQRPVLAAAPTTPASVLQRPVLPPEQVLVFKVRKYPDEDDTPHFHLFPSYYGLAVHVVQLDKQSVSRYLSAVPVRHKWNIKMSKRHGHKQRGAQAAPQQKRGLSVHEGAAAQDSGLVAGAADVQAPKGEGHSGHVAEVSLVEAGSAEVQADGEGGGKVLHVTGYDTLDSGGDNLGQQGSTLDQGAAGVDSDSASSSVTAGVDSDDMEEEEVEEGEEDLQWGAEEEQVSLESDPDLARVVTRVLWRLAQSGVAHVEAYDPASRSRVLHALGYVNDIMVLRGRMEAVALISSLHKVTRTGPRNAVVFTILLATDVASGRLGNPAVIPLAPVQQRHGQGRENNTRTVPMLLDHGEETEAGR